MKQALLKTLTLILFFSSELIGYSTDFIITHNLKTYSQQCKKVTIDNNKIYYNDVNGELFTEQLENLANIRFSNNNTYTLEFNTFELDTIECNVKSINGSDVAFSIGDSNHVLPHTSILGIFFSKIEDQNLNKFVDIFYSLHSDIYKKDRKIIKKDGTFLNFTQLLKLENNTIEFKDNHALLSTNTSNLTSVRFKDNEITKTPLPDGVYYLTNANSWHKVNRITAIYETSFEYGYNYQGTEQRFSKQKSTIIGIFFYELKGSSSVNSAPPTKPALSTTTAQTSYPTPSVSKNTTPYNPTIRVGINVGFAKNIGEEAENPGVSDSEWDNYIKDISNGYFIDGNFHVLFGGAGVGINLNQFNSEADILGASETLKIKFAGASILVNPRFINNMGYTIFGVSIGQIKVDDEVTGAGGSASISGQSIGLNLFFGADFLLEKNVAIGFKAGLIAGSIDKPTLHYAGQSVKLDEKMSLTHFDLSIGLKLYL